MSTAVLLLRHERNDGDRLRSEGAERAAATGAALRAAGVEPTAVLSSPRRRCLETVRQVLKGGGYVLPPETIEPSLGDLASDPTVSRRTRQDILERAASLGLDKAQVMLEHSPHLLPLFRRRGEEGVSVLLDWIGRHAGTTTLVCSHGGSRLEPLVCVLTNIPLSRPAFYFPVGSFARFEFEGRILKKHEFLGVPAEPTGSRPHRE